MLTGTRAAEFIAEHDPFGDHFSVHDRERIERATSEAAHYRAALDQIRVVCIDNEGPTVRHDLALKFVRDIASSALTTGKET